MSAIHRSRSGLSQRGRQRGSVTLNLVSLMDIFTILVFFLMVNSSSVELLETLPDVRLPDSVADTSPKASHIVSIGRELISVNGVQVMERADLAHELIEAADDADTSDASDASDAGESSENLARLQQALAARDPDMPVVLMADEAVPYQIIKQVMRLCRDASVREMSFAVNQISGSGGAGKGDAS